MNKEFSNRLYEFLESECTDFGLSYSWSWVEDCGYCEVEIKNKFSGRDSTQHINFKFDEGNKELLIELSEDSYYQTREYDETVKYFWMQINL